MKIISLAVIAVSIVLCIGTVAQVPSAKVVMPDRKVGAADVFYFKDKNKTRVQVSIHPIAQPSKQATLSMDVIFESEGKKVVAPKHIQILFSSSSLTGPKYKSDHDLTIYTKLTTGFSRSIFGTRVLSSTSQSSGVYEEILVSSAIEYYKFLEMLSAESISIKLGTTLIELSKEETQSLGDLKRTIEK